MLDHEVHVRVHGRVHECLFQLVENFPPVDTFLTDSSLLHVFNDPEEYEKSLHGRHHLFGAEMLESLQGSSKKRSCMGEMENKDKNLKRKNFERL
jgi:hypothetical protein